MYLKSFKKENFASGKEYELIAALIMKNWFRITYKVDCKIGIKINPKYARNDHRNLSFEEVKDLIEIYKDENDPMDFVVCPLDAIYSKFESRLSAKAWAFQVKRFGEFQNDKTTEGLKRNLSEISKKYSQSKITLVFFFDGHKGVDPQAINSHIKTLNFPFREVMFINTSKNSEGIWKMNVGEFWPNWGYNEYEPTELVKIEKE